MAKMFTEALLEELQRTGLSMRQVCIDAGVSYDAFKKVSAGKTKSPNVDDAIKLSHALGKTIEELTGDSFTEDRAALAALWRELSPAERDVLKDAARGRVAAAREEELRSSQE